MRRIFYAALCLLVSSACSTAKVFEPMDNCLISTTEPNSFACVDAASVPYSLPFEHAVDLVCFHSEQIKKYNETCHRK